jgi:hypothetical protein
MGLGEGRGRSIRVGLVGGDVEGLCHVRLGRGPAGLEDRVAALSLSDALQS